MSEFYVRVFRIGKVGKHPRADTLSITQGPGGYPVCFKTGEFCLLALLLMGCTIDVTGVPERIKLEWPTCEVGQVKYCTPSDAGADGD